MMIRTRDANVFIVFFRFLREDPDQATLHSNEVITMRTNTNEINLHLLLCNDVNRLREAGKLTFEKSSMSNQNSIDFHSFVQIIEINRRKLFGGHFPSSSESVRDVFHPLIEKNVELLFLAPSLN